jgi:C-terminal processing protease CtpA/Prc
VSNPVFDHELGYAQLKFPDAGYQLLALFRFWNIIRYWSPYRDLIDDNWDAVLAEFIPRLGQAGSADDYQRQLIALIARVHDTHANLWSSLGMRPPPGDFILPAVIRFVEGQATVIRVITTTDTPPPALQRGDVIRAIGGAPVDELVKSWRPYFAASNEPTRLRDIGRTIGRGPAGPVTVRVQRGQETLDVEVTRIPAAGATTLDDSRHDLPGDTFRLLSKDVAYLKLSSVKAASAASYVQQAAGTKGWIIDARDYPSEFMVFTLGSHFVEKPTEFARFTLPNPANPGAFAFGQPLALRPQAPRYTGKLVILVDEVTQSSAEYTTMAFRAAPGAIVIGSTTAAADGNVSNIPLPGGQRTMISGIGVFYPDKLPTQRVGIVPDLESHPTLAGIRAGRDEVLEVALKQILGPEKTDDEIRRLVPVRD